MNVHTFEKLKIVGLAKLVRLKLVFQYQKQCVSTFAKVIIILNCTCLTLNSHLSDCNRIRTHKHLVRKLRLNHLVKLALND